MPKIYKPYEKQKTYFSPTGHNVVNIYELSSDINGHDILVKVGEKDNYEYIQSFAEESDINKIIKKLDHDPYKIEIEEIGITDISKMPENIGELNKLRKKIQKNWKEMKDEDKEIFGNFENYMKGNIDNNYIYKKEKEKLNNEIEALKKEKINAQHIQQPNNK